MSALKRSQAGLEGSVLARAAAIAELFSIDLVIEMKFLYECLQDERFWLPIDHLANELLAAANSRLKRKNIHQVLLEADMWEFLANNSGRCLIPEAIIVGDLCFPKRRIMTKPSKSKRHTKTFGCEKIPSSSEEECRKYPPKPQRVLKTIRNFYCPKINTDVHIEYGTELKYQSGEESDTIEQIINPDCEKKDLCGIACQQGSTKTYQWSCCAHQGLQAAIYQKETL